RHPEHRAGTAAGFYDAGDPAAGSCRLDAGARVPDPGTGYSHDPPADTPRDRGAASPQRGIDGNPPRIYTGAPGRSSPPKRAAVACRLTAKSRTPPAPA